MSAVLLKLDEINLALENTDNNSMDGLIGLVNLAVYSVVFSEACEL